jgi:hypothetical protein
MTVDLVPHCAGCGAPVDLARDVVIRRKGTTQVFCCADDALDYMHDTLPRSMHEAFQAQLTPEGWRKLGSNPDF